MSQVHRQAGTSHKFWSSSSPSSPVLLQPMHQPRKKAPESTNAAAPFASSLKLLLLHLICALGLASAFWVAFNYYSVTLIQNSARTLLVVWAIEASVVILVYSLLRRNPDQCSVIPVFCHWQRLSYCVIFKFPCDNCLFIFFFCLLFQYVKAIVRGLLGLLAGAFVNALGAIVLGAPVGIQHFTKTIHWSLLMSVFTFVPAASVFGSSWTDWHRIFAQTKPLGSTDFMICFPAHSAVIGAWFGAWPMPLDWERPWQEWPICVTYGAIFGYLLGLVVSFGFVIYHNRRQHGKGD
ncbi:Phosphatidylinositol-glycan biosynthesis class F protein [Sesamum alatum]|uniref:Phosphatidylinositol-glycan biosynthesis class F protein n=1 Tax=Sesamum alatum TaxID=300844 RepID=A0AAE1YUG7_9LAMI|nr:Phosphatidylinositol-glycan biosynthesis class F protein [Sesamum alatum]